MIEPTPIGHRELTVCFADLAGYSALTQTHGDDQAAEIAERYAKMAHDALREGDRLIKTLGDAVLLVSLNPSSAIGLVERLLAAALRFPGLPILRVGLHHGPVVERGGDIYGNSVNLAARIAASAGGYQVLGTAEIAETARARGFGVASLGLVTFKNIHEKVEVFRILIGNDAGIFVDPVCQMRVEPATAAAMISSGGRKLWFCSAACLEKYRARPDAYYPSR